VSRATFLFKTSGQISLLAAQYAPTFAYVPAGLWMAAWTGVATIIALLLQHSAVLFVLLRVIQAECEGLYQQHLVLDFFHLLR
jgi:hypothetical protein